MIDPSSIIGQLSARMPKWTIELAVIAAVVFGCYQVFHQDETAIGDAYKSVIDVQSQAIDKLSNQTISLINRQNEQYYMLDSLAKRNKEMEFTVESLSTKVSKLQTRVKTTEKALEDCVAGNTMAGN